MILRSLIRASVLVCCLVAVSGCWLQGKRQTASPDAAKIHVRYQYTGNKAVQSFNVYRSASPHGPFERINEEPVEALKKPEDGRIQLLLTDTSVTLGKEYFYYLEGIDAKGREAKLTRVTRARATLPLMPEELKPVKEKQERKTPSKDQ